MLIKFYLSIQSTKFHTKSVKMSANAWRASFLCRDSKSVAL